VTLTTSFEDSGRAKQPTTTPRLALLSSSKPALLNRLTLSPTGRHCTALQNNST